MHLAGFEGNGSRAGYTLKLLSGRKSLRFSRTLGEHAWSEFVAETGEGIENLMIGMLFEEFANSTAVQPQLFFEREQLFCQCDGQAALRGRDRSSSAEAMGCGKYLQAFAVGLRSSQTVAFKEFLPTSLASADQLVRGRERDHEFPRST